MEYDNTNSGALHKNDKGDNPKRPDYKGSLDVGGQEFWVSAWIKKSKAGNKYMSLSVEAKEAKQMQAASPAPANNDEEGDIPF